MATYPSPLTPQEIADNLTRTGQHWAKTSISISFNNFSTSGNTLSTTQIAWIKQAIASVAEVLGLNFTYLSSGTGDITFNGTSGNGTYTSSSYNSSMEMGYGDIYIDQSWSTNQTANMGFGGYGLTTFIHEFLHALGLQHPGDYNGNADYFPDAEYLQDTRRYTIMSYFSGYEDGSGTSFFHWNGSGYEYNYPQTMMVDDILALTTGAYAGYFDGYSLNTTTRASATTYGYNASGLDDAVYDFTVNTAPVLTIYDTGGIDTLDLSGDTVSHVAIIHYASDGTADYYDDSTRTSSVIDLREGAYSSTNGMINNIGIAYGTVIENAIGTSFNDTMYGNDVGNVLEGRVGNDTMYGFKGNDTLNGGTGTNTIDGGSGRDVAVFSFTKAAATIVHNADGSWTIGNGSGTTTTLTNVEVAQFSDSDMSIRLAPAADFNASNSSDILWRNNSTGALSTWMIENGYLSSTSNIGNAAGWEVAGVGDFDGDGTSDVLWRNTTTGVASAWMLEDGAFSSSTNVGGASGWEVAGVGDFNGDGTSDILWYNPTTGAASIWLLEDGHYSSSTIVGKAVGWEIAGVGDFNGDGTSDIIWRNATTEAISIWMIDDGYYSSATIVGKAVGWELSGVGDFNSDGTSDILWRNSTTGSVANWQIVNGHLSTSAMIGGSSGWEIVATGDYDSDGTSDVLLRNPTTNVVATWIIDNGHLASSTKVGTVAGYTVVS